MLIPQSADVSRNLLYTDVLVITSADFLAVGDLCFAISLFRASENDRINLPSN